MRWWVAWMLPVLLLRALIPVGFMPMAGPGFGLQLVICDSYAPMPGTMSTPMDAGMDMSQHPHADGNAGSGGGLPAHQDHGSCPYGSSPAWGALPTFAIVPVAIKHSANLAVASAQVGYFKLSTRAQSPRGPPV
jgi:hypothetical protein